MRRSPLESTVQANILRYLNDIENSEWEKPTRTNKAGSPDIKGHIEGHYIAIEVKRDRQTKPSKLQTYRIAKTLAKGGIAFWAYTWSNVCDQLLQYSRERGFSLRSRSGCSVGPVDGSDASSGAC